MLESRSNDCKVNFDIFWLLLVLLLGYLDKKKKLNILQHVVSLGTKEVLERQWSNIKSNKQLKVSLENMRAFALTNIAGCKANAVVENTVLEHEFPN